VTDKKGRDYWYHKDTKETSWTNPEENVDDMKVEKYLQMNVDEVASESEIEETARTETQRRYDRERKRVQDKAAEEESLRGNLKEIEQKHSVEKSNGDTARRQKRKRKAVEERARRDEEEVRIEN